MKNNKFKQLIKEHKKESYIENFYNILRNIENIEDITNDEKIKIFNEFERFINEKQNKLKKILEDDKE